MREQETLVAGDEPETEFAELVNAADKIQAVVRARWLVAPAPATLIEQWGHASDKEILAAIQKRRLSASNTVHLLFCHAERLAHEAANDSEPSRLIDALTQLCFASTYLARFHTLPTEGVRRAALLLADEAGRGVRLPQGIRHEISAKLTATESVSPDWVNFLARDLDAAVLRKDFSRVRALGHKTELLIPESRGIATESAADLLAEAASEQHDEANESNPEIEYDKSDAEVKIRSVELCGIRGALNPLKVSFVQRREPVSALIFGENGSGKSTIVDAIEFALQGRIGRSTLYDSPVAPALRSLSTPDDSWSRVDLSDGTKVERRVITNSGGSVVADPLYVRPGFRLAPVTIQRADILRFLDTGALSRGSILLDYFPVDAEKLAIRPGEIAHRLETELTELRIKRTTYVERLAPLLGVNGSDIDNRDQLSKVIKNSIYQTKTPRQFSDDGDWARVDPELRQAIQRLSQVYGQMAQIKGKVSQAENHLNPVLHRRQTQLLKVALQGVADEITVAFKAICREHPVDRIDIVFGRSGPLSLDIRVGLPGGKSCFPQQIFSEAYRDLLALLFFTSVAKKAAERGQSKILILDDVMQSVDAGVRQDFMNHVLRTFKDWQLIFTVHDRLWLERLRSLFNSHGHRYGEHLIKDWSYQSGPVLHPPGIDTITKDLLFMLEHGEPESIVGRAGPLLEKICREMCARFSLLVPFKQDGHYMLADLWTATEGALRSTRLEPQIRDLSADRALRNLAAHADPKILELSLNEAKHFGEAVLKLYEEVRCPSCRRWVNEGKSCDDSNCVPNIKL
ncbi:MAG: hypothetical protein JWN15_3345 [Firmicutes bacterium]|nr:hypothetical protein [Bacillota bacterium]